MTAEGPPDWATTRFRTLDTRADSRQIGRTSHLTKTSVVSEPFDMSTSLLASIRELLASHGAVFREVHHEPTFTSEQSARARGEELRLGGKALLLKGDDEQYRLFVLPADRKVDSAAIRKKFGFKRLRF